MKSKSIGLLLKISSFEPCSLKNWLFEFMMICKASKKVGHFHSIVDTSFVKAPTDLPSKTECYFYIIHLPIHSLKSYQ